MARYEPSDMEIEYIKRVRKTRYNKQGVSLEKNFAIVATMPVEVNLKMIYEHGNGWINKPGVLSDFLRKNPQYKVGNPDCKFRENGSIYVSPRDHDEASKEIYKTETISKVEKSHAVI